MAGTEKVKKWTLQIETALRENHLPAGDAAKLVGRLLFGAQYIFRKMGRAMLRPLYQQQFDPLPGGRIGASLRLALVWWAQVLSGAVHEKIPLQVVPNPQVELFCDTRSTPPRVAAVMYKESRGEYTAWDVPASVMHTFNDAPIIALDDLIERCEAQ